MLYLLYILLYIYFLLHVFLYVYIFLLHKYSLYSSNQILQFLRCWNIMQTDCFSRVVSLSSSQFRSKPRISLRIPSRRRISKSPTVPFSSFNIFIQRFSLFNSAARDNAWQAWNKPEAKAFLPLNSSAGATFERKRSPSLVSLSLSLSLSIAISRLFLGLWQEGASERRTIFLVPPAPLGEERVWDC